MEYQYICVFLGGIFFCCCYVMRDVLLVDVCCCCFQLKGLCQSVAASKHDLPINHNPNMKWTITLPPATFNPSKPHRDDQFGEIWGGQRNPLLTSRPLVKMRVVQAQFRLAAWRYSDLRILSYCKRLRWSLQIFLPTLLSKNQKKTKKKTSLLCQKKTGMAIDASFFSFASGRQMWISRHGSVATAQMTPAVDEMVKKTEVRVSSGEAYTYYIISSVESPGGIENSGFGSLLQ